MKDLESSLGYIYVFPILSHRSVIKSNFGYFSAFYCIEVFFAVEIDGEEIVN
jgi:hypothetical protein